MWFIWLFFLYSETGHAYISSIDFVKTLFLPQSGVSHALIKSIRLTKFDPSSGLRLATHQKDDLYNTTKRKIIVFDKALSHLSARHRNDKPGMTVLMPRVDYELEKQRWNSTDNWIFKTIKPFAVIPGLTRGLSQLDFTITRMLAQSQTVRWMV